VAGLGGDDTVIEPSTAEGDTLDGGAGLDTISFAARLSPVVIQFGSMTQEAGSAGEGNVVRGFESAEGGSSDDFMTLEVLDRPPGTVLLASGGPGDDRITTGAGADHVSPGPGDDVVSTGGGSDQVSSSSGEDRLAGGAGADVLAGGAGRDVVTGGAGADRIGGGSAADVLRGGAGRDVLVSRDRVRDSVDCGSGSTDRAVADRRDRVRRCERVRT
jgi:Ca2+-binding RTX toxin-like protein